MVRLLTLLSDVSTSVVTVKMIPVGYDLIIDAELKPWLLEVLNDDVLSDVRNSNFKFR